LFVTTETLVNIFVNGPDTQHLRISFVVVYLSYIDVDVAPTW